MAEERKLSVGTVVSVPSSGAGKIETKYSGADNKILSARISDSTGSTNGTKHKEGELLINMTKYPAHIDASMNSKGELVLLGKDLDKYSISEDGELLYTYEE
jgi:hypothetical protein